MLNFFVYVVDVAQKLIGEDHVISGVSVYINNADPKGSKDNQNRHNNSSMSPFQYGSGYSGRGNPSNGNSRYFGGGGSGGAPNPAFDPRNSQQFSNPMGQGNSGMGFGNSNPAFNSVSPAFIAAALDSWNTMVSGMFGAQGRGGGNPGGGNWQNNDGKKDHGGPNWGGKGDAKWS